MAQSAVDLPSPSPHTSPSQSDYRQSHGQSIETLISYLVAAKRSLGSIHLVQRATSILADGRSTVETTTALIARTTYLRRSLSSQLKILRGIQFELEAAAQAIQVEFQNLLKELDATDKQLENSIILLKDTKFEDGFRGRSKSPARLAENAKENLHDFVDEKPVQEIRSSIKNALDNVQHAHHDMGQSIQTLEDDLQAINEGLSEKNPTLSDTESELRQPQVSKLLRLMEDQAREMAESLESLVKHFDLCVTAIKHTEGAGAAAAKTIDAEDLPEGVGADDFDAPALPITEEEHLEMLQVLETDAAEVDDVVAEIQDRSSDMEAQLEKILIWRERTEHTYQEIAIAFNRLDKVGSRLTNYVAESARHQNRWVEEKSNIENGIVGLQELCAMWNNFLSAYDRLIVEAARRKTVKKQMERIVQEAHSKLEQLYQDDLAERDVFNQEQGDFLPSDIWSGLHSLPPRFAFSLEDDGVEADSIPELPRKTVEDALRRLKAETGPSGRS